MITKSKCTRERYRKAWKTQMSLDTFGFQALPVSHVSLSVERGVTGTPLLSHPLICEDPQPHMPQCPPLSLPQAQTASCLSDPSESKLLDCPTTSNNLEEEVEDGEEREDERVSATRGSADVREWSVLRQ